MTDLMGQYVQSHYELFHEVVNFTRNTHKHSFMNHHHSHMKEQIRIHFW